MINICYIISGIAKSFSLEWNIEYLDYSKYTLHVVLMNSENTEFEDFLRKKNISVYRIPYSSKSDLPGSIFKIKKYLKKERIEVVHCHLFEATIAGLIAARLAGVKKRIYTRHNSTINLDYYPNAVKYDKLANYLATDIIAISKVVKDVLINREGVAEKKISVIYHGFDFDAMDKLAESHKQEIGEKYDFVNGKYPVVGVVSRFMHYKGLQYIIPAFQSILNDYPNARLVLCNAGGPYSKQVEELLRDIPNDNYTLIDFERNIFSLYKFFNVFIHAPVYAESEAFGLSCIEAWAMGVPAIYTGSGIVKEVGKDGHNCILVDFKSQEMIENGLLRIIKDADLQKKLAYNGINTARSGMFNITEMIKELDKVYER